MRDVLGQIRAFLDLTSRARKQLEYWKDYKGEEIWIRRHQLERVGGDRDELNELTFVIKGTIDDVMSYPPGFLLRDVEEVIHFSDYALFFPSTVTEAQVTPTHEAEVVVREVGEKFVSFDAIEQLERGAVVEAATEPLRETEEE